MVWSRGDTLGIFATAAERRMIMDVREKLVELLKTSACPSTFICDPTCKYYGFEDCFPERFADYLIAHGVTVQEWISVKDKLPEVVSIHKGYRSTVKKSIRVLCVCVQKSGKTMVKEGYCEWYNDYQEPRWQIPGTIDEVTHWQYLPNPPKGE